MLVYVDPELDEIRYGGFEQHERTIAPLRGLNVHFNEKFKVAFCEDNQATIHIIQTGNSAQLRHADRTQRTSLAWLREQFTKGFFNLVNVNTVHQVAQNGITLAILLEYGGLSWMETLQLNQPPLAKRKLLPFPRMKPMIGFCANFAVLLIPSSATNEDYLHLVARCLE